MSFNQAFDRTYKPVDLTLSAHFIFITCKVQRTSGGARIFCQGGLSPAKDLKIVRSKENENMLHVAYLRHGFEFFLNGFAYMCVPTLVSLVPSRTR